MLDNLIDDWFFLIFVLYLLSFVSTIHLSSKMYV